MKAEVVTLDNEPAGTIELAEGVFGAPARPDILARVVNWQLAKRRAGTHSTKSTGEVAGSTRKLGRQKGGGSARHGSRKANVFRGGAVAHGPRPRSHAYGLPRRVRALGLRIALSVKAAEGKLVILENADLASPRTRELAPRLAGLGLTSALVVDGATVDENFRLAAANIVGLDVMPSIGANVHDILSRDTLVLTRNAVAALQQRLG